MKRLCNIVVCLLAIVLVALPSSLVGCKKKSSSTPVVQAEGSGAGDENAPQADGEVEGGGTGALAEPEGSNAEAASNGPEEVAIDPRATEGTWTTTRLIALAPTGPALIDLSVNVAGQSLDEAAAAIYQRLGAEVMEGLETPVTWEAMLQQPLIQSGWVGNLVAEDEQAEQLIGMYDADSDGQVDDEELPAFFSRGLARNDALFVSDVGAAPNAMEGSPWGKSDEDEDFTLSFEELQRLPQVLGKKDFDGDSILTAGELELRQDAQQTQGSMGGSFVQANSLVAVAFDDDVDAQRRQRVQNARELLQFYTYLEGIPREQWRSWSDERWADLDKNGDGLLVRKEIEKVFDLEADCRVAIRFPALDAGLVDSASEPGRMPGESAMMEVSNSDSSSSPEQTRVWVTFLTRHDEAVEGDVVPKLTQRWASKTGPTPSGQLAVNGLIANFVVEDSYTRQGQQLLRQQLNSALAQPQLREFFINQLQLQEDAFELLDADGDEKLSDAEFQRVWSWLSSRQGTRLLGRWMTTAAPWFQLLDQDADDRITPREMEQGQGMMSQLDWNRDQQLTPDELPLMIRFELRRADNRLARNLFGLPQNMERPEGDQDWFAAMDTNRDGYVNRIEFLGPTEDFQALDQDKDGFLHRTEVYNTPASE